MRNIIVNDYVCELTAVRNVTRESLKPFDDVATGRAPSDGDNCYFLSWGDPVPKCRTGIMETGFFWDALHIDTIGLYAQCSLNTVTAHELIKSYKAPKPAADVVLKGRLPATKYRQAGEPVEWTGVVLALQNPTDRSIHRGSSTEDYYRFVEMAAARFKQHLFLKLHPWNTGDVERRFTEIANKHGCRIGRANHRVIERCKFVLVYNSTFVVDCLLRGVKVAQYAPGYFYQCPGVTYTAFELPDDVPDKKDEGYQLCNWLVWRYCFYQGMSIEKIVAIFRLYANSNALFPLTEEHSYAGNIA